MTVMDQVLAMDPLEARAIIAALSEEEKLAMWLQVTDAEANPYFRYRNNPLGFVHEALGEATWSKQREIYEAIAKYPKVAVAACHSVGKSHVASRVVVATGTAWPADMVKVMTTATNFRQVKGILWPYISRIVRKYDLPGEVFTTAWKIGTEQIGEGFSANNQDEAAVQGWHALGELLLVVDEAGGIRKTLGTNFNAVLTGNAHALAIGNPPTDQEDTWFQEICESPEWHFIRISAFDTPNFTAEIVGRCTVCPPTIEWHTIAKHTTDRKWVASVAREFGVESAYYQARVLAKFPKNIVSKTLPISWLEASMQAARETEVVPAPIKLGVDVASDGGDELVVARAIGWRVKVTRTEVGAVLQNSVNVAGMILEEIEAAQKYHDEHGFSEKVRVKVDRIGVGWGVVSTLQKWADEGRHKAEIVGVSSAEKAHNTTKFRNQRSEMWWTVREVLQPSAEDPETGVAEPGLLLLEIDQDDPRTLSQLNAPKYSTASTGQTVVQPKPEVKAETGHSPDRGDAILLAVYEPPKKKRPGANVGPIVLGQSNYWSSGAR